LEDLTGQTFGPYQIISEIGHGGMATVYKAYQPSLNRYVALKVLPPGLAHNRELIVRFKREAENAAKLSHPHVVHVYDTGEDAGRHYIAMEYIDGGSLRDRLTVLSGKPMEVTTALEITAQIADALDYAHRHGIVHRDIKPSNILLTADGRAVLSDLGISRAAEATQLTQTGASVGTPEYMSPEQAKGEEIDGRSDLYSLGIVLYEMLTGRVPFRADTPYAVIYKHLQERPTPPTTLNAAIPRKVAAIITRALEKDAKRRFRTANEMARALREALPGKGGLFRKAAVPLTEAPTTIAPTEPPAIPQPPAERVMAGAQKAATAALGGLETVGRPLGRFLLRALLWTVKTLAGLAVLLAVFLTIVALVASFGVSILLENVISNYPWNFSLLPAGQPTVLTERQMEEDFNYSRGTLPIQVTDFQMRLGPGETAAFSAEALGTTWSLETKLRQRGDTLEVELERANGRSLPLLGNLLAGGINRGIRAALEKSGVRITDFQVRRGEMTITTTRR